jgi:hypothetical protein
LQEVGENCTIKSFIKCTLPLFRIIKSGQISLVGHVARVGDMRNVYKMLTGKPERKKPFGIPHHR